MQTSEQIQTEIARRLGALPPLFRLPLDNPSSLAIRWRQTVEQALDNSLPASLKVRLCATIARYTNTPFDLIYHGQLLFPPSLATSELFDLLSLYLPSTQAACFTLTGQEPCPLAEIERSPLIEAATLRCAAEVTLAGEQAIQCRRALHQFYGDEQAQPLFVYLGYLQRAIVWLMHAQEALARDLESQHAYAALIGKIPALDVLLRPLPPPESSSESRYAIQHEHLQQLQEVLAAAPLIVFAFDQDGVFTLHSGGGLAAFRLAPGSLVGTSIREYYSDKPSVIAALEHVFADEPIHIVIEESGFSLKIWCNPLHANAKVTGGVGIVLDITSQQRTAEELRKARVEAERANRAKSEFLSRISHELRTPMNAILGFAQILQLDPTSSPKQQTRIEHILQAGQHLLRLIDEVLQISDIEAGQIEAVLEPVALNEVIFEVVELLKPAATRANIDIHADLPAMSLYVCADRQHLAQVLLNLLSNGVKYNSEYGRVVISTMRYAGHVRIAISDTGKGIATEQLDQLFSPFERLGAEHTKVVGTGLGLALSKGLVELMGGQIGVESVIDQGSTFWVELAEGRVATIVHNHDRAEHQHPSWKVLYIENNLESLSLIEDILANRDRIRLLRAMKGSLGIELASTQNPDLVLLDMNLPDIAGEQVLMQLRDRPETRSIPVVVISADTSTRYVQHLHDLGANRHLSKPLNVRTLLEVLDSLK